MKEHTRGSYIESTMKTDCIKYDKCRYPASDCTAQCEDYVSNISEVERLIDEIRDSKEVPGGSCPSQYALPDNITDLQDLIEHRDMNFAMGNIFKACYRSGNCSHSDLLRDINKVLWFANRERERLTNKLSKP